MRWYNNLCLINSNGAWHNAASLRTLRAFILVLTRWLRTILIVANILWLLILVTSLPETQTLTELKDSVRRCRCIQKFFSKVYLDPLKVDGIHYGSLEKFHGRKMPLKKTF